LPQALILLRGCGRQCCGLLKYLDCTVVIAEAHLRYALDDVRHLLPVWRHLEQRLVELDRLAGEALDVLVNGTLVAHGEVVVVNEKFGIRLTDVVSAQERVRKLR